MRVIIGKQAFLWIVPSAFPRNHTVRFFPGLLPGLSVNQGKHCARNNRNIRAMDDFQQPQRVSYFLVSPAIAAHYGKTQDFHVRIVKEQDSSLKVSAGWPIEIIIENNQP